MLDVIGSAHHYWCMPTIASPTGAPAGVARAVGSNVAAELTRHKVSRQAAADELGMSTTSLGHRIAGRVAFRVDELDAIALLLGVSVRAFIDDDVDVVPSVSRRRSAQRTDVSSSATAGAA